jgi:hypothetical protein
MPILFWVVPIRLPPAGWVESLAPPGGILPVKVYERQSFETSRCYKKGLCLGT